jgi:Novel toxin 16
MNKLRYLIVGIAIVSSSMALAQTAPPGSCTATQHRSLQDQVDSSCAAALKCLITEDRATLNLRITKVNACIAARTNINNTCFAGGDAGHKEQIVQRNNQLATCKDYLAKVKP